MSGSDFEKRRESVNLSRRPRHIFDPRLAGLSAACEWCGVAAPELFPGKWLGELHDQSVFDETDKHLPASVAGRKTEQATSSEAAVVFDEINEEWLKIGSKRNRHATSDCKLLLFLLQQFAFSVGAPAVTAKSSVLLYHAMARDDEADVIGRTGACDRANGPGRANPFGDVGVGARFAIRNRL